MINNRNDCDYAGDIIRLVRARHGISIDEIANILGVTPEIAKKYASDELKMPRQYLPIITNLLR